MATYYVYSGAGGTNAGTSWTNAYTAFGSAVTAATASGDIILVHYTHQEELAADTTYTFANNVIVLSVNKDSSDALTAMSTNGWIGKSVTTSYAITIGGAYKIFIYGVTLRNAGITNKSFTLNNSNGGDLYYENCYFWLGASHGSNGVALGSAVSSTDTRSTTCKDCTFRFSHVSHKIWPSAKRSAIIGGSLSSAGTAPTGNIFYNDYDSSTVEVIGFDMSFGGSCTIVGNAQRTSRYVFTNCKLGASFVAIASQTTRPNMAGVEVFFYNCEAGDTHYGFGHHTPFGALVAYTTIRASDAPTYDGTNGFSWRIDTTANASFYAPYVSPWVSTYHSGASAITPRLEILRDGSATAYDDDEVWGEFSYQGTTGYPLATIVNDRMTLLGTPAAQATGMGTGSWTGEGGTAWSGKVNTTATITPAEIGELKARVCVGLASATVYVDPQIRTA